MTNKRLRHRLNKAELAIRMLPALPRPLGARVDDAQVLAVELAAAFGRTVADYRQHFGLSPEEARERAGSATDVHYQAILDKPPNEIEWTDLDVLTARDSDAALKRWHQILEAARQEVCSGHRAARAMESHYTSCWQRAQFLAMRAELSDAWRPRDALEQQLIDQLAQWQTLLWEWQDTVTYYTMRGESGRKGTRQHLQETPCLSAAEALEQAAHMVERFHRRYLQTLKAMQDGRRRSPVVVRRAGQVNINQQQVNLNG